MNTIDKLNKNLTDLQTQGGLIMYATIQTNFQTYKLLSSILFWWLEAKKHPEFLQAKLDLVKKKTKTVGYGENFTKLLWLIYGINSGFDRNYADRYSRLLNKLKAEYESKPDYYEKDGVEKMANFVVVNNGIDGLIEYGKANESISSVDNTDTAETKTKEQLEDFEQDKKQLLQKVWFEGPYIEKNIVPYHRYLSTNSKNFSLLLVERTQDGINVVDSVGDEQLVNDAVFASLTKRFDLIADALRPLFELIQTQCLPQHLAHLAEKLVTQNMIREGSIRRKISCYRRVLFKAETGEFILSPIHTNSGVVSVIKPFFNILAHKADEDLYMPHAERLLLEQNLLRTFEFNFYTAEIKELPIPQYLDLDLAFFVVHIKNTLEPAQFQNISFNPFYKDAIEQETLQQVDVNPAYQFEPIWSANYASDEFKRVYDVFLSKWLCSHANYLNRKRNARIRIDFEAYKWTFNFIDIEDAFSEKITVSIQPTIDITPDIKYSAVFRSIDVIPALKALSDLPITRPNNNTDIEYYADSVVDGYNVRVVDVSQEDNYVGGVTIAIDENVLRLHFFTEVVSGAEHTIHVPISKETGLATEPFIVYSAKCTDRPCPLNVNAEQSNDVLKLSEVVE